MTDRQEPDISATIMPVGEARLGNDNQIWKVVRNKVGKSNRWIRQTKLVILSGSQKLNDQALPDPKKYKQIVKSYFPASKVTSNKKYYVHDNGGRPFLVIVSRLEINVYAGLYDYISKNVTYQTLILTVKKYAGYWIGTHKTPSSMAKWARGNTILIKVENKKYIFVGDEVFSFETTDDIYDYHSEVGNNDVPYPIALGTDNLYFMTERTRVERNEIRMDITFENLEHGKLMDHYYGRVDYQGISYYDSKTRNSRIEKQNLLNSKKLKKYKVLSKRNNYSSNIKIRNELFKSLSKRHTRRQSKNKNKSKK